MSVPRCVRVLSPMLFAMLVIMAIVTTLATTPVLQALAPRRRAGCRRKLRFIKQIRQGRKQTRKISSVIPAGAEESMRAKD